MRLIALASALALFCASPSASAAASGVDDGRACPFGIAACEPDSMHAAVVRRARGAQQAREWHEAAELWRSALVMNDRVAEHWTALASALTRAGNHRDAIAAYQRAIQLDASTVREGAWNVARAYALLGNHKQASRWVELALEGGLAGNERHWSDPLFDRYRGEVLLRRARKAGGPASLRSAQRVVSARRT